MGLSIATSSFQLPSNEGYKILLEGGDEGRQTNLDPTHEDRGAMGLSCLGVTAWATQGPRPMLQFHPNPSTHCSQAEEGRPRDASVRLTEGLVRYL